MKSIEDIHMEIDRLTKQLLAAQAPDGSWHYCFESGTMTDSYMIIILRLLQLPEEQLVKKLCQRIAANQHQAGYWSVYPHETNGNLSATVEAYYALLYSGYFKKDDTVILKAKAYILENGGLLEVTSVLTNALLAATGQLSWSSLRTVPIELLLLPDWSPINFNDIVGYAKVHIVPILIMSSQPDTKRPEGAPDLSDLLTQSNKRELHSFDSAPTSSQPHQLLIQDLKKELLQSLPSPNSVKQEARKKAENFILERIEPNGTLYSYASATFLMILSLLSLGYDRRHPLITKAIQGIKSFTCPSGAYLHIQNSTTTVWNTALISHALQQAGLSPQHSAIQQAGTYLLSRQQHRLGDWFIHNKNPTAGGWGFSDINTIIPDIDDRWGLQSP